MSEKSSLPFQVSTACRSSCLPWNHRSWPVPRRYLLVRNACMETDPDLSPPKFNPLVPTSQASISYRVVLRSGLRVRGILWYLGLWNFFHERHCWKVGVVLDLCTLNLNIGSQGVLIQSRSSRDLRLSSSAFWPHWV